MNYKTITEEPKDRWKVITHLIMQHGCKNIAEVGVSRGDNARNTINLLNGHSYKINNFYLIDIPQKDKMAFYNEVYSGQNADKYKFESKGLESCTYLNIGSEKASQKLVDKSLDFIFIDADTSSYEPFKNDIIKWLPKLSNNGIMAGRYFDLRPKRKPVCSTAHIKTVVDEIFTPQKVNLSVLNEMNSGKRDYIWWYKNE